MISWIVASHDPSTMDTVLRPSLEPLPDGDELIVIPDAPSITLAYAAGQARAVNEVRCYVHHDVRILDLPRLRAELVDAAMLHPVGMVGVVGSRDSVMPWWNGPKLGSVVDARMGLLDFGPGGPCAMLDGLLLATRRRVEWDVAAPGWHGYDQDACSQMLAKGWGNWCLTGAGEYVVHEASPVKDRGTGYEEARARWVARWAA